VGVGVGVGVDVWKFEIIPIYGIELSSERLQIISHG
jgi:hypothetical protein